MLNTINDSNAIIARFATEKELADWDSLIAQNPDGGDFKCSKAYIEARKLTGAKPRYLVFQDSTDKIVSVASVLERSIPLLGKWWYISHGPAVVSNEDFATHISALRIFLKQQRLGVFNVLLEPGYKTLVEGKDIAVERLSHPDLLTGPGLFSNNDTVVVSIDKNDSDLLAGFNAKCRNKVRRAIRDEVEVVSLPSNTETFAEMYRLMNLVGGGKKDVSLRSREYLEFLWRTWCDAGLGEFRAVLNDGKPAIMSFTVTIGSRTYYVHGGSERPRTTPGMSNFLQYANMLHARDNGATEYDMCGIAPAWAKSIADHSIYEVGVYKLSFSGRTTYTGTYNLPIKPLQTKLWLKIGERIYAKLYRMRTGDVSIY